MRVDVDWWRQSRISFAGRSAVDLKKKFPRMLFQNLTNWRMNTDRFSSKMNMVFLNWNQVLFYVYIYGVFSFKLIELYNLTLCKLSLTENLYCNEKSATSKKIVAVKFVCLNWSLLAIIMFLIQYFSCGDFEDSLNGFWFSLLDTETFFPHDTNFDETQISPQSIYFQNNYRQFIICRNIVSSWCNLKKYTALVFLSAWI